MSGTVGARGRPVTREAVRFVVYVKVIGMLGEVTLRDVIGNLLEDRYRPLESYYKVGCLCDQYA